MLRTTLQLCYPLIDYHHKISFNHSVSLPVFSGRLPGLLSVSGEEGHAQWLTTHFRRDEDVKQEVDVRSNACSLLPHAFICWERQGSYKSEQHAAHSNAQEVQIQAHVTKANMAQTDGPDGPDGTA